MRSVSFPKGGGAPPLLLVALLAAPTRAQQEVPQWYQAAATGDVSRLALMLEAGQDINEETDNGAGSPIAGMTALMYASSQGRLPALQYLLSSGANPNLADRNGNTALHMVTDTADESIAVAMAQALLARGGLKSIRNFQDYTPFDTASIQQRDSDYRPGYRPMDIALFSGSDAVAALLAVT